MKRKSKSSEYTFPIQAGASVKGYLTVFLSLTLTVIISLCLTLIEGVRRNTIILETQCAADTGMNSILAEYHRELMEQYDVFFMDTSYGAGQPSYEKTAEHLREYMNKNFTIDLKLLPVLSRDLLKIHAEEVQVLEASMASDEDGAVLRRQAVDSMKEKTGIGYVQKIMNWMETVNTYSLDRGDFQKQEEEAWKTLEAWESAAAGSQGTEDMLNPAENLKTQTKAGILHIVADAENLSRNQIIPSLYLTGRSLNRGTGMNTALEFNDGLFDTVLFHEYILNRTGRYGSVKENGVLAYQTEYILGGRDNDVENLKQVVNNMLIIRETANVLHILSDEKKTAVIKQLSEALAALTTIPQTAPVFQITLTAAWAYLESLRDVKVLLEGGRIPLLKTKEEWYFGFSGVAAFQGEVDTGGDKSKGLEYADYLHILLMLQDKKTTTYRLMDIMEMDIRLTEGNRYFRMDGCIDSIGMKIKIKSAYGYEFLVTRVGGY